MPSEGDIGLPCEASYQSGTPPGEFVNCPPHMMAWRLLLSCRRATQGPSRSLDRHRDGARPSRADPREPPWPPYAPVRGRRCLTSAHRPHAQTAVRAGGTGGVARTVHPQPETRLQAPVTAPGGPAADRGGAQRLCGRAAHGPLHRRTPRRGPVGGARRRRVRGPRGHPDQPWAPTGRRVRAGTHRRPAPRQRPYRGRPARRRRGPAPGREPSTPKPRQRPKPDADEFELLAADLSRAHDGAVAAVPCGRAQLSSQAGSEQKVEVFVNLARRLQSLVHREISILDELENEIEPELLRRASSTSTTSPPASAGTPRTSPCSAAHRAVSGATPSP